MELPMNRRLTYEHKLKIIEGVKLVVERYIEYGPTYRPNFQQIAAEIGFTFGEEPKYDAFLGNMYLGYYFRHMTAELRDALDPQTRFDVNFIRLHRWGSTVGAVDWTQTRKNSYLVGYEGTSRVVAAFRKAA
jgi:hypothetical protein